MASTWPWRSFNSNRNPTLFAWLDSVGLEAPNLGRSLHSPNITNQHYWWSVILNQHRSFPATSDAASALGRGFLDAALHFPRLGLCLRSFFTKPRSWRLAGKHNQNDLQQICHMAVCQNLVPLVNIKIAGKWVFIPLKKVLIGIDPYPHDFLTNSTESMWLAISINTT